MHTTTNTRLRRTSEPTIRDLILSSGQPLQHLDFPTRPNRQAPGHTNQGESSKHARHFLFSFSNTSRFSELTPVRKQANGDRPPTLDAGNRIPTLRYSTYTITFHRHHLFHSLMPSYNTITLRPALQASSCI